MLDGTAQLRAGAFSERIDAGEWRLFDDTKKFSIQPETDAGLVRTHCPASLLGQTTPLSDCVNCLARKSPEIARGFMDAAMRYAAFRLNQLNVTRHSEDLFARGLLLQILSAIIKTEEDRQAAACNYCPSNDFCIEQAARYLEQNYAEPHSLKGLANQVRTNEHKIKQGFRRVYNTTVFGYLRQVRMKKARELFQRGETTVNAVAIAVGYSNPSHFARAFRDETGMNPKTFTQKCAKNSESLV